MLRQILLASNIICSKKTEFIQNKHCLEIDLWVEPCKADEPSELSWAGLTQLSGADGGQCYPAHTTAPCIRIHIYWPLTATSRESWHMKTRRTKQWVTKNKGSHRLPEFYVCFCQSIANLLIVKSVTWLFSLARRRHFKRLTENLGRAIFISFV